MYIFVDRDVALCYYEDFANNIMGRIRGDGYDKSEGIYEGIYE